MCDLLSEARAAAAERHRNGEGWYCCNCGELIGRLADEIERLRAELRRVSIHREGVMKLCLICFASADLGDAIEHTSECLLHEGGDQ